MVTAEGCYERANDSPGEVDPQIRFMKLLSAPSPSDPSRLRFMPKGSLSSESGPVSIFRLAGLRESAMDSKAEAIEWHPVRGSGSSGFILMYSCFAYLFLHKLKRATRRAKPSGPDPCRRVTLTPAVSEARIKLHSGILCASRESSGSKCLFVDTQILGSIACLHPSGSVALEGARHHFQARGSLSQLLARA